MEQAGRLVLYSVSPNWLEMWGIFETDPENRFMLRVDGNMVMVNRSGQILWQSETKDADHLDVHDNGYLISYNSNEEPVWVSENFKCTFIKLFFNLNPLFFLTR